jgi:beta-lactamase regulating signal transducer with metallopeptidase domain
MAIIATHPMSMSLLAYLLNSAIRGLGLAGVAAIGLAAFRVRNTSTRLFTWTAVLYGALAMPLLMMILPALPVPAPALLQFGELESAPKNAGAMRLPSPALAQDHTGAIPITHAQEIQSETDGIMQISAPSRVAMQDSSALIVVKSVGRSSLRSIPFSFASVATAAYVAVTLFFLMRFCLGLALSRRLLKRSLAIAEPRVTRRLADRARSSGIAFVPEAAESESISVPVTVGVLRSKILLPSEWREWDDAKLDAVIAHEVSHVARRDALTQCLSLLHRSIFWFSPVAWWLDGHLADLAEQASDEAALSSGADRKLYARTLLSFFEALHAAPGRVWWQGVSMAKAGQAAHRVQRILAWKEEVTKGAVMRGAVTMNRKRSIAVAIVALAVPVVYLGASVRPIGNGEESQHVHFAQSQSSPSSEPAQAETGAAPDPAIAHSASGPSSTVVLATPNPHPAPAAAVAPRANISVESIETPVVAAAPAVAPRPAAAAWGYGQSSSPVSSYSSSSSSSSGSSYQYGADEDLRFVIGSGKFDSFTMSGSTEDARHAEKLRKQIPGDFIWFERDEKSYIIRDQATIDRAKKFWEPQQELDRKQEELGQQQEALGKQQEELGEKMEQVRVKVPDMTAELDKLRAELKQLSSGATIEQVGQLQSEIGDLQSKIGEIQSQAGDQQSKLGDQQGALGQKQGQLGARQGQLGRQQAELARQANHKMKQLLDEAIKNGTAQRDPDSL